MLVNASGQLILSTTALADRAPAFYNSTHHVPTSMSLIGSMASYAALYKAQLWVGVVIRKLAGGTARLPFGVQLEERLGKRAERGILDDLLRRPNPQLSGHAMWRWISSMYDIYGEAFLIKIRDARGRVRELWPMHPANIIVRRSDEDGRLKYQYAAGGAVQSGFPEWDEADVVAFLAFNPDTMTRGLSNLEGLRMTLINEDASRRATQAFWQNGARPGVILEHPGELKGDALSRLQQQYDAGLQGPEGYGKTKVLEEGMKANMIALNLEEMQYIESRKLNREEVCSSYDVPPPAVHILDRATFSNITEQLRSMYRDTMAPRNEFFESVIDEQLVTDFYSLDTARSRFDMDEVLRGDFETRASAVGTLIEKGVYKPSEARPLFGLDPAGPEADQLYGNAALVPLGTNARQPQQVATDGTLIPTVLSAGGRPVTHGRPAVRALMGKVGRLKGNKVATREKLAAELGNELKAFFETQRDAIKSARGQKAAGGLFEPADWDDPLAEILHNVAVATSQAIGTATATDLGGTYDDARISDWLLEDATTSAKNINQTTAQRLDEMLERADTEDPEYDEDEDLDGFFDGEVNQRAGSIAWGRIAVVAGLAALVAAELSNAATKTWIVTSAKPRASHAAMDGETVALGESFSNGMDGPGDFAGGADEVAGCTCELQFNT